ncbi:hypothetical protein [Acinetobacter junii]|uniref:DUF2247 family protein n=1 Tax=Acinetobacter junii TaxID=40215 RepID=A0AAX1MHJ4_ACIJU|nr:hypothetical protein [Acinetobacter junii]QUY37033.1 hypothetical protein H2677_02195 [Acinetobacter junii]
MSDIEKAIFKAKLELETITLEEIQRWAIETLEKDSSNDLALEICFLSTPEQIKDYFKQVSKIIFDLNLTKNMIQTLLEEYLSKKVNLTQTQSDFYPFFYKLFCFAQQLKNEELYDLLNYYDDQFDPSLERYNQTEPEAVFQELLADLETFCSETSHQESSNNS